MKCKCIVVKLNLVEKMDVGVLYNLKYTYPVIDGVGTLRQNIRIDFSTDLTVKVL